jgi:hypothetical protein
MYTLTQAQVQQAMLLHANNNTLTVAQVQQLLQNVSVTFAQIVYVTRVQLAAAHKQQNICKVTHANVLLASNISAQAQLYARAVRKSAAKYTQNNAQSVQNFAAQANYFVHTATHCIVQHAQHAHKFYLYAIYNNARSAYVHNNAVVSKQHVAQYCTASAAAQLLQESNTVHNVTNNIVHSVQVRTIALNNIVSMRARKQLLTV